MEEVHRKEITGITMSEETAARVPAVRDAVLQAVRLVHTVSLVEPAVVGQAVEPAALRAAMARTHRAPFMMLRLVLPRAHLGITAPSATIRCRPQQFLLLVIVGRK